MSGPSKTLPLGDLVRVGDRRVDPAGLGDALVEHFSLPAFDVGRGPAIEPASAIRSQKAVVEPGSILVSKLNPHIPRVWLVPDAGDGRLQLASTEFVSMQPDAELADPDFLYYLLCSPDVQQRLASNVTGTSTSHQRVHVEDLLALPVTVPPLEEQRAIVEVLRVLDDKVAANEVVRERIERLATAVFKLISKDDGSGAMVSLGDVASITKGVSYRSADLKPSSVALVTLKSFDRRGGYRPDGLKPYIGPFKPEQAAEYGDVGVAQTDITQGAEVVGRAIRIPRDRHASRLVASLDVALVRPKDDRLTKEFLYGLLRTEEFRAHCQGRANGTTVLHLASDAIPTFTFRLPDRSVMEAFTDRVRPLWRLFDELETEKTLLNELRSALLPLLVSGQLAPNHRSMNGERHGR